MADHVELRLEPLTDRFDALDDRWLEQVDGFVDELDEEVGGVDRDRQATPGEKASISPTSCSRSGRPAHSPPPWK